jgi:hypothetical protein
MPAVQLHVHLIEVPPPVAEASHPADPLPANLAGENRSEPVPPHRTRLVTYVNAALEQQILDVAQAERKRTYISTTRRITSGELLKYRNGLAGLRARGMPAPLPALAYQPVHLV